MKKQLKIKLDEKEIKKNKKKVVTERQNEYSWGDDFFNKNEKIYEN